MYRLPQARTAELVVQTVGTEIMIYDASTAKAHVLNESAALVWKYADGRHDRSQIARFVSGTLNQPFDVSMVDYCLEQLDEQNLLDSSTQVPSMRMTRRDVLKRATLIGAVAAVPVIVSIAAPSPAAAQSTFAVFSCCNYDCGGAGHSDCLEGNTCPPESGCTVVKGGTCCREGREP
jgi:hypothetical protein